MFVSIESDSLKHRASTPIGREEGSQATSERLLDAAEALFASRGLAGASVREITTEAGANVAAVNYHFGNKLGLYREVVVRRFREMREQRLRAIREYRACGDGDLEGLVDAYVRAFLRPTEEPERAARLMRLFTREMVEPQVSPRLCQEELLAPVDAELTAAILETEKPLDGYQVRRCVRSLGGLLWSEVQAAHFFGTLRDGRTGETPFHIWVDHVVRFVTAGIRACSRTGN
jgi:AcrR family transcriptional regulator